jgi:hypothetical protein
MTLLKMRNQFTAIIEIIGANPFVFVPDKILNSIFKQANKDKGTIAIRGAINEKPFKQTLVRYSGAWRLYINTTILKDSPKRIGEKIKVFVEYDPEERITTMHSKLETALSKNKKAKKVFDNLSPSRKKEIMRYINNLKNEASVDANVVRAIQFLSGKGRFVGRDKP